MEFEEQEDEMAIETESYDSLGISTRVKMPGSGGPGEILSAQPVKNNNFINHTSTNININSNNGNGNNNSSSSNKPRYRECLKNHAVGMGGHALDGCGEFMPAGAEGTLDGLKCAACNCHRNFHRKETDTGGGVGVGFGIGPTDPYLLTHHPPPQFAPYYRTPAGYLHVGGQQRAAMLALPSTSGGGGGGGTQSTRELDQEDVSNPSSGSGSKKRFRTKFSQEQKEKLLDLAEKLGWRIQKHDEAVVQQFCTDYGVKRHVLKVWMHNNKHTLGKKP